MFKKKNPCIKHKLWGRLKYDAHTHYRIVPHEDDVQNYRIEFWCVDHYTCSDTPGISSYLTLYEAKKRIEEKLKDSDWRQGIYPLSEWMKNSD